MLRTNLTGWTPADLWQTYIQLTEAEAAFRTQKSELSLRPVWHQLEHRVQAHILFSFLAYAMWKTLQQWMARSDLGHAPRMIAPYYEVGVQRYFPGWERCHLDARIALKPDELARMADEHRRSTERALEQVRGLPTPDQLLAELLKPSQP